MLFGGAVIFAAYVRVCAVRACVLGWKLGMTAYLALGGDNSIVGKMSQHASNMNARAVEQQKHLTTLDEFFKFYKLPHNLRR